MILIGLHAYIDVANLSALLWFLMLLIAIIVLIIAALFAYDAWNYGRKKKDVRRG
jgi:heme/copper-type cytochrome/quinol oxidase subunit 2